MLPEMFSKKKKRIWRIPCDAGLFDFSITGADGLLWIFPDGTTSTDTRPAKTLATAGTVIAKCNNWAKTGIAINGNGTNTRYIGSLADLPALTYYLSLYNCTNVTGIYTNISPTIQKIYLNNTGLSASDLDQTLINLDNASTSTATGKVIDCTGLTRTSASDTAVANLRSAPRSWTVTGV